MQDRVIVAGAIWHKRAGVVVVVVVAAVVVARMPTFGVPQSANNSESKPKSCKNVTQLRRILYQFLSIYPSVSWQHNYFDFGENSNSNSKTLILKDSSVRSIWTYLTASPCYTTNTNKHDNTTNKYYKH